MLPPETADPQSEETFLRSKLDHNLRRSAKHGAMWEFYKALIQLRKTVPALACLDADRKEVWQPVTPPLVMSVRRWTAHSEALALFHFGDMPTKAPLPIPQGCWRTLVDSSANQWQGSGSSFPPEFDSTGSVPLRLTAHAAVVFVRG